MGMKVLQANSIILSTYQKIGFHEPVQKSVNLQYNTLGCLVDCKNDSLTKHLMSQVLLFFS